MSDRKKKYKKKSHKRMFTQHFDNNLHFYKFQPLFFNIEKIFIAYFPFRYLILTHLNIFFINHMKCNKNY